jgi:wobble nucleotide-excising tRNase
MTIVQIKHVQSVGRFRNCPAKDDVAFKKFTLLFGENGRGKTTLCAILRSLQTNQPAFISGRTTLGSSTPPQVVIATADGQKIS